MENLSKRIHQLISLLEQENESQLKRWNAEQLTDKVLRSKGELLFPVQLKKYSFSFDDFPTLECNYANYYDDRIFQAGSSILLYDEENNTCKASILSLSEQEFTLKLFAEFIPEWVHDHKFGIKPRPDEKSFKYMKGVLNSLLKGETNQLKNHAALIYAENKIESTFQKSTLVFKNELLNQSQKEAVKQALNNGQLTTIQGPPGTGKTTTLVELICQLVDRDEKVVASAPSNTAVDRLAIKLVAAGLKIVRLGNTTKVNEAIWSTTPEGILARPECQKQLKKLRIEVSELRKKASQFKRNFSREDRENRKQWRQEAKNVSKEIRSLTHYILAKQIENADVVIGTPVGLCDTSIKDITFDVGVIDEAGQCLIPMGFLVMDIAKRVVLCGDHQQLPPTVIDQQAAANGLNRSILEEAMQEKNPDALLTLQYRMPPAIASFSSQYFYGGMVKSAKENTDNHLCFYDTVGAGFHEVVGENGSISNEEELEIILKIIDAHEIKNATFISPYAGQVNKAKRILPAHIKCSTIDGFQGQEAPTVILSLVRNNEEGKIGFLKDYRRMNVAITRAQEKLIVIGDSTTLAGDEFYRAFMDYIEEQDAYKSVFEVLY
jgi:superfamily I DNA and/or RNA helicase